MGRGREKLMQLSFRQEPVFQRLALRPSGCFPDDSGAARDLFVRGMRPGGVGEGVRQVAAARVVGQDEVCLSFWECSQLGDGRCSTRLDTGC